MTQAIPDYEQRCQSLEAQLASVLARESASVFRHDDRVEKLERRIAELTSGRLHELAHGLAYEFVVSVMDSDLVTEDDDLGATWFDEGSDCRTDQLIPECMEYLGLRGLIERREEGSRWFAIRDESEATA